jgi:Lrp/AsnC family transcriptional regulator, leucine-responsive regulatory protein
MTTPIDDIDRQILDLLQRDARMTNAAIAAQVGLAGPSVFERIRKLEQRGVIRGYTVTLDPAALGRPMTAFIRITAAFDERYESGIRAISQDPEVLECYNVAGEDCFILKTQCGSPTDLEALLGRIRSRLTVLRSVTMIALSALKEHGPIHAAEGPPRNPARPARARKARLSGRGR